MRVVSHGSDQLLAPHRCSRFVGLEGGIRLSNIKKREENKELAHSLTLSICTVTYMGALPPLASMLLCTAQQLSLCLRLRYHHVFVLSSGFCFPAWLGQSWQLVNGVGQYRTIGSARDSFRRLMPTAKLFQHVGARTFGH